MAAAQCVAPYGGSYGASRKRACRRQGGARWPANVASAMAGRLPCVAQQFRRPPLHRCLCWTRRIASWRWASRRSWTPSWRACPSSAAPVRVVCVWVCIGATLAPPALNFAHVSRRRRIRTRRGLPCDSAATSSLVCSPWIQSHRQAGPRAALHMSTALRALHSHRSAALCRAVLRHADRGRAGAGARRAAQPRPRQRRRHGHRAAAARTTRHLRHVQPCRSLPSCPFVLAAPRLERRG